VAHRTGGSGESQRTA